ncbi:6081_t:CDS:2, partial [Cetraspora pellucida]
KDNDGFVLRFSCECEENLEEIYNNPTSAILSLYQCLFGTTTKFSGPLIMGFEDKEILTKLLFDIPFRPFSFKLDKLHIFVYSIGISDNSCLYGAGPGFNSSFISVIKKDSKAKSAVVIQGIKKTGFLKQYEGNALFGLNHYRSQESQSLNNNLIGSNGKRRILSIIADSFSYKELQSRLHVSLNLINTAKGHACINGYRGPAIPKPQIKRQIISELLEDQYESFMLNKTNVNISSYKVHSKTGLPLMYLTDNREKIWERFHNKYPEGLGHTAFLD